MGLFDHERELAREFARNTTEVARELCRRFSDWVGQCAGPAWRWYWHHFLKGVGFHLPLVAFPVVLVLLPLNMFGEELGVVQVIWYADPLKRFVAGAALAMLVLQSLFVSYVLWDRARLADRLDSDPGPVSFRWFVVYTFACLFVTVLPYVVWELLDWLWTASEAPSKRWASSIESERWYEIAVLPFGALVLVSVAGAAAGRGIGHRLTALGARVWNTFDTALSANDRGRGDSHRHRGARVAAVVAILAVWCPMALLWSGAPLHGARVGAMIAGACFFVTLVLIDLRAGWRSPGAAACVFVLTVLSFSVPVFLLVTAVHTEGGFALAVLAFGACAVVLLAHFVALARPAREWLGWVAERARKRGTVLGGPLQLWPFVLLVGVVFFLAVAAIPPLQSPASIVCGALFGLLVVYALATVLIRRAAPVAIAVLVLVALYSSAERYKYRFPGLGTSAYADPVDLHAELVRDRARSQHFESTVACYAQVKDEIAALESRFVNVPEVGRFLQHYTEAGGSGPASRAEVLWYALRHPADAVPLIREYDQFLETRTALDVRLGDAGERARACWGEVVQGNRVIPPFLARVDLGAELKLDHARPDRPFLPHEWNLTQNQKDQPLIAVAVSGGGLRSAAWTFTVLRNLEEQLAESDLDFPAQVRIITGASGGMLGAAYYVTSLRRLAGLTPEDRLRALKSCARKNELDRMYAQLTKDHLTPIVRQFVFEDAPGFLSPWVTRDDRGRRLEGSWTAHLDGALDVTFDELRCAERNGLLPSLVFAPMMVEDGRRLIVSNLDMRHIVTNSGNLLRDGAGDTLGTTCHSRDSLELFRLFPGSERQFKLSTAVRMSASFPFFSPAVSLPTNPRRRVVDAGYYDNYGVNLAATWIKEARETERDRTTGTPWLEKNSRKVLLIQIRDGVDQPQRALDKIDTEGSTRLTRSFEEVSSPFEGLLSARVASTSFRNDALLSAIASGADSVGNDPVRAAGYPQVQRLIQVATFEFEDSAALSWYLSPSEKLKVQNFPRASGRCVELIGDWWNPRR